MEELLRELVAETQDVNWKFSLRLARFRHADRFNFDRLSDLVIAFLQSIEQGTPVSDDERLKYLLGKLTSQKEG
jgi:hypothetical protein